MNDLRRLSVLVGLLGVMWSSPSLADVKMTVVPILGAGAPPGFGFSELAVRLDSTEKGIVRGVIEASTESPSYRSKEQGAVTSAEFVLTPGASTTLRIPVVAQASWQLLVVAKTLAGSELSRESVRTFTSEQPTIVDVRAPSRLPAMLAGVLVRSHRLGAVSGSGSTGALAPSTSSPVVDATTGDPVLPDRPTGYAQASAVCFPSDVLSRLVGAELDALAGYVLSGGTLAVNIVRPEDLRHPTIVTFVGGVVEDVGAAKLLAQSRVLSEDRRQGAGSAGAAGSPGWGGSTGSSGSSSSPRSVQASPAVREALRLYAGGNLIPSDFGATAAYGLGEVHLLAFDPSSAVLADDPWVAGTMAELVRHAFDRSASIALPLGGGINRFAFAEVRKQLDPNESSRWAIFVAAILLLAYSAITGPWSFLSASRAGKPLRALLFLPVFSFVTFVMVVAMGMVSRGFSGQSRRLSLVEIGGGMSRGSIHRFRGFFTPRATTMRVASTSLGSVMDLPNEDSAPTRAVLHRGGMRLENVGTLPWETIVVREEDVLTLGQGITLGRRADGDLDIVNRSGRQLRGVLAWVPKRGMFFHALVKDGASILGASGQNLGRTPSTSSHASTTLFDGFSAEAELDGLSPGLTDAWKSFEKTASRTGGPIFWPSDVPVVLAQLDGGEGIAEDSGLRIDRDRLLVRVLGYGGAR